MRIIFERFYILISQWLRAKYGPVFFFSCGGKKVSKYINKAKPFGHVKDWPYIAPELRDGAVSPSTASCVFFGGFFYGQSAMA